MAKTSRLGFKLWVMGLITFLILFRLFEAFFSPSMEIIPDKVTLGVVVVFLVYLWLCEIQDRQSLLVTNAKLLEAQASLKQANIETIATLINLVEAKDPYTRGHSERVEEYSLRIAKEINLPETEMAILKNACILHDIGKTSVPDSVLNKKEKLTNEEWEIIKMHPSIALKILEPLTFLNREKELIVHHHEKYSGGGYPDGISGEKIPFGARIMTVADSFDAMRSRRAYRDPLSEELILHELENGIGTQFDPQIARVMIGLLKAGKI